MSLHQRRFMLTPRACDALWAALLPHMESVTERSLEHGRFATAAWIDDIRDNRTGGFGTLRAQRFILSADGHDEQFATELFRENLLRACRAPKNAVPKTTRKLLMQVLHSIDDLLDVPIIERLAALA